MLPSYPLCSPPTPVVLADCESAIPALGCGFLPKPIRSRLRSAMLICSKGDTGKPPLTEVVVDGPPRREVAWQQPPRTAAFQDVEDWVEDGTRAMDPRSTAGLRRRKMWRQEQLHSASERSVEYMVMQPSVRCRRLARATFQTVSPLDFSHLAAQQTASANGSMNVLRLSSGWCVRATRKKCLTFTECLLVRTRRHSCSGGTAERISPKEMGLEASE